MIAMFVVASPPAPVFGMPGVVLPDVPVVLVEPVVVLEPVVIEAAPAAPVMPVEPVPVVLVEAGAV